MWHFLSPTGWIHSRPPVSTLYCLFFLANDGAMTFLERFIPLPAKLQSAFPHSRHRSSFSGHCILTFNIFRVTPLHISIKGIFQISHWISIFRPTEMGGQVKQHVNFLQVCKFQKPLSFWTELLNHYSKRNKTMKITWREPWSSWQLLGLLSFQKFLCALKPGNHHEWFGGEFLMLKRSICEQCEKCYVPFLLCTAGCPVGRPKLPGSPAWYIHFIRHK